MYRQKKILAIIPARSGSKGLKDKNIKELNGKPLIAYTIEAAKKSGVFEDIVVSTDSDYYAKIAVKYGAQVPYLRPKELSSDISKSSDVILHEIEKYEKYGKIYDYFMLLQPTSPLRDETDIKNSVDLLINTEANSVVSVCECEHSHLLTCKLDISNRLDGLLDKINNLRRQDMESYYRLNGAIYISNVEYYKKYSNFYKEKCTAYIMDKYKSIDIDDIYQFKFAELLLKSNLEGEY